MNMIDDLLLVQLKGIGLSEYEAKVYAILIALRVASAREIHEQTKIPRGKIYETLTSLAEKGFIVSSGKSPVRYSPVDVIQTFERLKRESVTILDELSRRLKDLETETPEPLMQGYKLCTDWTRENQVRMLLRRAKTEIILLCTDKEFLARFHQDILQASKRIALYLVVDEKNLVDCAQVKCYHGQNDIITSFFHHGINENTGLQLKVLLLADRYETLSIMEDQGNTTGIFICPDILASYLSRKIVQEIKPITMTR